MEWGWWGRRRLPASAFPAKGGGPPPSRQGAPVRVFIPKAKGKEEGTKRGGEGCIFVGYFLKERNVVVEDIFCGGLNRKQLTTLDLDKTPQLIIKYHRID